jgi:hypothetical protein
MDRRVLSNGKTNAHKTGTHRFDRKLEEPFRAKTQSFAQRRKRSLGVFFAPLAKYFARNISSGRKCLANITLLHWNIQTFSNNKLNNANGQALIDYIAQIVSLSGANIVSLLELKNNAVANIMAQLVPAINLANGVPAVANQWNWIFFNSTKNNEAYVVLWEGGHNFVYRFPAAGGGVPINGLTNQTLVGGVPGGVLRFNSGLTQNGGRRPYYLAFRTTDTMLNFTIVAYHTMFGYWSPVGVRSVGRLGQSRAVADAGITINMDASFTCGDFNVDFNNFPADYNNLNNISSAATNENTSLVVNTPPGGFPTSPQYRLNAYDNIFHYDVNGLPPGLNGVVPDLILESTTPPPLGTGTGLLSPEAGNFVAGPIPAGHLIQNIPPDDFEDSWHIVRHAISDHLPVYINNIVI